VHKIQFKHVHVNEWRKDICQQQIWDREMIKLRHILGI